MSETPKGVVAILSDDTGRVWATATDFSQSRPGGFSVEEAQRHRAEEQLGPTLIRDTCLTHVADVMDTYDANQIVAALVRKKGWRVTIKLIGYDEQPT